jgi:ribosomal-protein-alanine N-acetyltransferase
MSLMQGCRWLRFVRAAEAQRYESEERAIGTHRYNRNGELAKPMSSMPVMAAEIVGATMRLYSSVGYEPPWIGYLAFADETCVGACGFKSPPANNRVEIAYFTFPEHESRGVATQMASELIRLAREKLPAVTVASANVARRECVNFRLEEAAVSPRRYARTSRGRAGMGMAAK